MRDNGQGSTSLPSLLRWEISWLSPPWQLTAAWAGVGGFLLAGAWPFPQPWWLLLLVALLVDPVWGAWWRSSTAVPTSPRRLPGLPYARAEAPWARWHAFAAPGAVSGFLLAAAAAGGLITYLGEASLWPSLVAAVFALAAGWVARVLPGGLRYLAPVYGLGLPLWAGGYIAGRWVSTAWLAGAVVALAWAQASQGRSKPLLGIGGSLMWAYALASWAPRWLVGLTLVGALLSVWSREEARSRTVWGILLALAVLARALTWASVGAP